MHQVFISFFFKKPKAKKTVRISGGARTGQFMRAGEVLNASTEEEVVLESGDEYSDSGDEDNFAVNEEADATIEEIEEDEGQTAHNDRVAKSVQERAIQYMQSQHVYLDADEVEEALQIFPRVSIYAFSLNILLTMQLDCRISTPCSRLLHTEGEV